MTEENEASGRKWFVEVVDGKSLDAIVEGRLEVQRPIGECGRRAWP